MIGLAGAVPAGEKSIAPDEIPGIAKVDAEGLLDLVMIDARLRQDRQQSYIEGSISLPDVKTTCASLAKYAPRKSSPVLFYCNGPKCGRSAHSCRKALACGYTHVYWFRGGFEEGWKKAAHGRFLATSTHARFPRLTQPQTSRANSPEDSMPV